MDDLKATYEETGGSLGEIMTHIPHSTHEDEARFVVIISDLISKGELAASATWNESSKDEKAKLVRKKVADKEAEEAEELARELGVWDEFYGSGKEGSRKGKGKGKSKGKGKGKGKKKAESEGEEDEEEDHSALQALILKKRQNAGSFLDDLAAKYADPQPRRAKGKRKKDATTASGEADEPSPKKRRRGVEPDPIDDEEFAKLQQKLFKDKGAEAGKSTPGKQNRAGRGRKS